MISVVFEIYAPFAGIVLLTDVISLEKNHGTREVIHITKSRIIGLVIIRSLINVAFISMIASITLFMINSGLASFNINEVYIFDCIFAFYFIFWFTFDDYNKYFF